MISIYEPKIYKESAIQAIELGWISNHGEFIDKATLDFLLPPSTNFLMTPSKSKQKTMKMQL